MDDENFSAERLREVLLDLEQVQQRERKLHAESEALLSGVRALSEATTPEELFSRILEALREPLAFEAAFVLRPGATPETLTCTAATKAQFLGSSWTIGKTFARAIHAGRVIVQLDTSSASEWLAQPDLVREDVGSAVCIPLRGSLETALLICTRKESKGFQPRHEQMAKRFQPLATQALRVAERAAQVERANRDMRLVLDAVDQGLLTVDRAMKVVGETSAIVRTWFGDIDRGVTFAELLARLSPDVGRNFALAWAELIEGWMPLVCALGVLPGQVTSNGRTLAIALRPIGDEENWTRMLIVVTDVTAALERDRAEERRHELATVVTRIVRDRDEFEIFSKETSTIIESLRDGRIGDRSGQLRALHTLKGNTSMLGLLSLAKIAHELEGKLLEHALEPLAFAELAKQWAELREEFEPIVAGRGRGGIVVTETEHAWLLRELELTAAAGHISRVVGDWRYQRADVMLGRMAGQATAFAVRLGKGTPTVSVEADDLRLDPNTWSPVFAALVHVVRNAIDHGMEKEEERLAAGKRAASSLVFREKRSETGFHLEIEDDGCGIDWATVARKAEERHLPRDTHEDLVKALLVGGLSTREEATDVSGRGVGMSAVREVVDRLGGHIEVESIRGRGTRVRCVFASTSARPSPMSSIA